MARLTKSKLSQNEIYESALQIIAEKGFENSTVRAIAKHSGLSIGIVHKYMGERDAFIKTLSNYVAIKAYVFLQNPPEGMPAKDKILFNCEQNLRFFLAHPHYGRFFVLMYYYASVDKRIREINQKLVDAAEARLLGYFTEAYPERSASELSVFAKSFHSQLSGSLIKIVTTKDIQKSTARILSKFREQIKMSLSLLD